MRVYEVTPDTDHFQFLLPEEEDVESYGLIDMDCRSRIETWQPPSVFCWNPIMPLGDFVGFTVGTLVVRTNSLSKISEFFESAGEILPLYHQGDEMSLLNVTECLNCMDQDASEWAVSKDGDRLYPKRYVFHTNRFSESSIFKIPETRRGQVLTLERDGDPEEDFKAAYEAQGMTGLNFELLWQS